MKGREKGGKIRSIFLGEGGDKKRSSDKKRKALEKHQNTKREK